MTALSKPSHAMSIELRHHRFSMNAYDEMIAHGILKSDDRVQLIAGEIVEMSPIGSRHAACVNRLTHFFIAALGDRAVVAVHNPVALPPDSEPEPNLAILKPRSDFYAAAHPRPDDVLLLVEVADSSIGFDRSIKLPIYAAAGIRETWIVDLTSDSVEQYSQPQGGKYGVAKTVRGSGVLAALAFPDVRCAVTDLLPASS
jgi:Uma2 family endonuclease